MKYLLITILALSITSFSYAADEEVTLTTYYPAPYGEYDELTVGGYTLPSADGTEGQVLMTDGDGNISWENANRSKASYVSWGTDISTITWNHSGSFAFNPSDTLSCSITVKADDLVMVHLEGQFKTDDDEHNGYVKAAIDATASIASAVCLTVGSSAISVANTQHVSSSNTKLYKATSDGNLTFKMQWDAHDSVSLSVRRRSLFAWIIGRA